MARQLKKYEGKGFDPADVIDTWLDEQRMSTIMRTDLKEYADSNQKNPNRIVAYLRSKGCACSPQQVRAWMAKYGIEPGKKAAEFNQGFEDYRGIDTSGVLEKVLYNQGRLMNSYMEIVDAAIDEGIIQGQQLQSVIAQLPVLTRETRQLVQTIESAKNNTAYNELILAGAQHFRRIMMEQVRDKPEHRWLSELSDGVMARILEYVGETDV